MAPPQSSENEPSSRSSSKSFYFLSLFPEIFETVLSSSLLGKARKRGLISYQTIQIRDFTHDKHRTADDTPYGGGEGMLLKVDVLYGAWEHARKLALETDPEAKPRTVLLSPQGPRFDQHKAKELAAEKHLILVCGHYEGVDERFIELCVDEELSIGDYVLTGGELPALVVADAVSRLVPGVVGNELSVELDSLEGGLLKYPQYTRPREFHGKEVPQVLLDGDHGAISAWRQAQAEERTKRKRPDLFTLFLENKKRK
jgi:tRNA (guanine37-N1)-methyltransferase